MNMRIQVPAGSRIVRRKGTWFYLRFPVNGCIIRSTVKNKDDMENNHSEETEEVNEPLDGILEQFGSAMTALQLQDAQSSEQALVRAKLTFKSLAADADPEEVRFLRVLVGFIEVSTRFLKSVMYQMEERYPKSNEELTVAKKLCVEGRSYFSTLDPDDIDDEDFTDLFETLKFMYAFFEHLTGILISTNNTQIEKQQGRYVDEVASLRKSAQDFRNFDIDSSRIMDSPIGGVAIGVVGMLGRFSDAFERKADRIEEQKKTIEFLKPINNRVFIVHGHNEGALRELKELLEKKCRLRPIILRDEADTGKTVIEKIEEYGRQCAFAFVIVTPDDLVVSKDKKNYQARPNVLFELGWFCGRYGRANVRIIRQKNTPLPSDLAGLITLDFYERIEEIFLTIKKDLKAVGII